MNPGNLAGALRAAVNRGNNTVSVTVSTARTITMNIDLVCDDALIGTCNGTMMIVPFNAIVSVEF